MARSAIALAKSLMPPIEFVLMPPPRVTSEITASHRFIVVFLFIYASPHSEPPAHRQYDSPSCESSLFIALLFVVPA